MDRLGPSLLLLAILLAVFALLLWGWRARLRRQSGVAPLPPVPEQLPEAVQAFAGQYVVTTTAGDWLDRIAVHGLGIKSNATVFIYPDAVLIERTGSPDVYIPAERLEGVRLESGMAGKFVEKDGLVVLRWHLGDDAVDTGFRTRAAAEKRQLVSAVSGLLHH